LSRSLRGERIGVLGLARSGRAAAELALARGAAVYASDSSDTPESRDAAERLRAAGAHAETGRHDVGELARCTRIVLSPGIPPSAPVLREPALADVPVTPEIEFAFGLLDAPVIAITGTNGKTTVTGLVSHLLETGGMAAPAGGNIGTALSELALRSGTLDWAVVETSSFQLAGIRRFAPAIGVVTNLAPDHLDWYPGVREYYADKARLFRNADERSVWVLNGEDEDVLRLPGSARGRRLFFRTASLPAPEDCGGWLAPDGWLTLRVEGEDERVIHRNELRILGAHNVANALAASLAARCAGLEADAVAEGLRSFHPPPHRLEPVGERDGVLWINDSKATNVASTRVALRSLDRPVVLLLGGRHKGESYTSLLPELRGRARRVVAFGEAAPQIETDLAGHCPMERVDGGFEEAVRRAAAAAHRGDAVLLSPACSSFDMFSDYEARGARFAELARGER
jgi:UDP-N-acetylmuramoylalanine--D-glutamate ligase